MKHCSSKLQWNELGAIDFPGARPRLGAIGRLAREAMDALSAAGVIDGAQLEQLARSHAGFF